MKSKLQLLLIMFFGLFATMNSYADSGTKTFTASGHDDDPTTVTITPSDLNSVTGGGVIDSIRLVNTAGSFLNSYCGNWYDFSLSIDGTSQIANGCSSDFNNYLIPANFSTIVVGSNDLDSWSDAVTITFDLLVYYTPPSCPQPSNLIVTSITDSSAQLNWVSGGSSNYNVEYGTLGFTQGTGTMLNIVTDTFVVINGLTPGTVYDWYVQDSCGVGDASVWVGPNSFNAAFINATIPVSLTFPFLYDSYIELSSSQKSACEFSATANNTNGNGILMEGGNSSWGSTPSTVDDAFAYTDYVSKASLTVDASSNTNVFMDFDLKQMRSYGNSHYNWVRVLINDTIYAKTLDGDSVWNPAVDETDWETITLNLSAFAGTVFNVSIQGAMKYNAVYSSPGCRNYIDNIKLYEPNADDVGIVGILGSFGGFTATANDTISVLVKNFGTNNQTNIPIKYMLDNGTVVSEVVPSLNSFKTDTFTFAATFDATPSGDHILTAYTELTGDQNNTNDTTTLSFNTAPHNEVGLISFNNSFGGFTATANDTISVQVKNYGTVDQINLPINYVLDNGTVVSETMDTLLANSTATYKFTTTFDATTVGSHTMIAYSSLSGDEDNSNDTLVKTFKTFGVHTIPFTEGFEAGYDKFINLDGNTTDFVINNALVHSGTYAVHDAYVSSSNDVLTETGAMDLSASTTPVLDFWQIAATENNYDKCYVEISTDNGQNWNKLPDSLYIGSANDFSNVYNNNYFDIGSYSDWTNTPDNSMWKMERFNLAPFKGDSVTVRFLLHSDGSVTKDGWHIDDITIQEEPAADASLGNDTVICEGLNMELKPVSANGYSYLWTVDGDTITSATSNSITVDSAATYAVVVTGIASVDYDTIVVTVAANPVVSFTGLASSYCNNEMAATLTGTPANGTFTGNGITANSFDPATAGLGEQVITYSYTDANACFASVNDTTDVFDSPTAMMSPDTAICEGSSIDIAAGANGGSPSLLFSGYIEGSGNNKALEIYNASADTINLDNYSVMTNYNGHAWSGQYHFPMGATLVPGDVFVIANASADVMILAVADDSLAYNEGGYVVGFNGDDVRAIFHKTSATDSMMVDIIGRYDLVDPGAGWEVAGVADATKDHTLIRKSSVGVGNTNWDAIAGTDSMSSEYLVYPKNDFSMIGSHTAMPYVAPTYLWSTGATTAMITVNPTATTVYTCTVSNTNCSDIDSVTVTVNPMPVVDLGADTTIKWSWSLTLDAANPNASFLWSTGATTQTETFDNTNLNDSTANTVYVEVTENGCMATDTLIITVMDDNSINNTLNNVNVSIYPNPSNGQFTMDIEGLNGNFNMTIIDLSGQVVYTNSLTATNNFNTKVDVRNLAKGVYYIKLSNNDGVKTSKLIIK